MEEYAKEKEKERRKKEVGICKKNNNYKQYTTKEGIIAELASLVDVAAGKEKAEILCKIADLKQMKKENDEKICKTVHFYLPAR